MAVLGKESLLAIRDYINDSNLIKVTYDELVDLRNTNKLNSGTFYQITDYRTETKKQDTKSALHNFDVIVLATSISTLSEDAYATYHINEDGSGDDYFCHREVIPEHQDFVGAEWISPMPSTEDIEFFYTLDIGEIAQYAGENIHETSKVITELTTMPNRDGITVPAMLNPDPNETGNECYYIYDGTFDITERENDYVQFQYILCDNEIAYGPNDSSTEDELICDIGYKRVVASAHFQDGITVSDIDEKYKIAYQNDDDYSVENPSSEDKEINYLDVIENERGIEVPCLVNLDPEGGPIDDYLIYVGTFTFNNAIYDMWQECDSDGTPHSDSNGVYMLTNNIVDAEFEDVPCLYSTQIGSEYENETDYEQPYVYDGTFTLDGVIYDKWNKYEFASGVYGIKTNYSFLTQRIISDNDFVLSREDFLSHVKEETTTYDKWQEYYSNPESSTYGFLDCWHLTNHLVDATIDTVPEEIIFEKIVNLDAYKLKYSLDNDAKFAWADNRAAMQVDTGSVKYLYVRDSSQDTASQYAWIYIINSDNTDIKNNSVWYEIEDSDIIYTDSEEVSIGEVLDMGGTEVTVVDYERSVGKGVIYRMVDDKNNDLSYDFKNIQYYKSNRWQYTFNTAEYADDSLSDVFCHDNIIKDYSDVDDGILQLTLNIFGDGCSSNIFGNDCNNNTFGSGCSYNTFGNYCFYNNFGSGCSYNTFDSGCNNNNFDSGCSYNTLGNNCSSNIFGNNCFSNIFDNDCNNNTFDNYCFSNTFGNYCFYNNFDNDCNNNTFGNNCSSNIFGNNCSSNIFGNNCFSNIFGEQTITVNKCKYIIIENGCQFLNITTNDDETVGYLQNIHICLGIKGTNNNRKTITESRNLDYDTTYRAVGFQDKTI